MPPRRLAAFRLDVDQLAALEAIKRRDGVPIAEQVRRAVDRWLNEKGVRPGADRTRGAKTRRRS